MFGWMTGSRINDVAELNNMGLEQTIIEPPETPAPIFAVNAFKHALFGTPALGETVRKPAVPGGSTSKARFLELDDRGQRAKHKDHSSPTKPTSILMTPGTINGRRKNVTFGSGVVDNEGKRPSQSSKAAVPQGVPGTFPSPYTPKEKQALELNPRVNFTASLRDAKTSNSQGPSSQPARSKDDTDVTLDVLEPRSQSGRYWKELHETYATKSEQETRKLIAKQKLAKDFAKKKDTEAAELRLKLDTERKKYRNRETAWETTTKDLQERLRKAIADNTRHAAELALMRQQLEQVGVRDIISMGNEPQQEDSAISMPVPQLPDLQIDDSRLRMSSSPLPAKLPSPESSKRSVTGELAKGGAALDLNSSQLAAPLSSDPMPTPTPRATSKPTGHSSRSYRVVKRPVTVTTARIRTAQPLPEPVKATSQFTPTPPRMGSARIKVAEDSDMDLWNISNMETSSIAKGPAREALKTRTANIAQLPVPMQTKDALSASGFTRRPLEPAESVNRKPMTTVLGTSDAVLKGRSPKHFPGSPERPRKAVQTRHAAAKADLQLSREEQAKQRIAARRAQRRAVEL